MWLPNAQQHYTVHIFDARILNIHTLCTSMKILLDHDGLFGGYFRYYMKYLSMVLMSKHDHMRMSIMWADIYKYCDYVKCYYIVILLLYKLMNKNMNRTCHFILT